MNINHQVIVHLIFNLYLLPNNIRELHAIIRFDMQSDFRSGVFISCTSAWHFTGKGQRRERRRWIWSSVSEDPLFADATSALACFSMSSFSHEDSPFARRPSRITRQPSFNHINPSPHRIINWLQESRLMASRGGALQGYLLETYN